MKNETMEQINNTITNIIEKAQREYNDLVHFMSDQTGAYVFEHAYECSAKTDVNYYFQEGGFTDYMEHKLTHKNIINLSYILECLIKILESDILDKIYEAHLNSDTLYTNSWNDLNDLVRYVIFNEII